jgi:hypothetical protein
MTLPNADDSVSSTDRFGNKAAARLRLSGLAVAGWVSIPVYFGLEGAIRLLNLGRSQALSTEMADLVARSGSNAELERVRLVSPARLPIKHGAITLGHTVFSREELRADELGHVHLMVHELVHVVQCQGLGRVGMAMAYGRGWVDGFSYEQHHMEVEARAAADEALPILREVIDNT